MDIATAILQAQFRVETVFDRKTRKYFVEVYQPANSSTLLVASDSIYTSEEEAIHEAGKIINNCYRTWRKQD